jgi:hypothetical protein
VKATALQLGTAANQLRGQVDGFLTQIRSA